MNGQTGQSDGELDDCQIEDSEIEAREIEAGAVDESLAEGQLANAEPGDVPSAGSDPATPVDELQAKADENWDRYLRAAAELENVRKRASRDVENARKYSLERFSKELLAVKDSLEMGLAAENSTVESLHAGSMATLKLLGATLQQFGVEEVDPSGEPFDPERHEAISMQESNDVEPGSVITVVQKGYLLNGRLLRPAMVIVAVD